MFVPPPRPLSPPRFAIARQAGLPANGPVLLSLLIACACHASAFGAVRDLEAHGSDERLWLARVEPSPAKPAEQVTVLFERKKFDAEWRRLPALQTRLAGLGSRGSQLVILLENGEWRLTTETSFASGRPLPDGGRMVAVASDAAGLWAVARVPVAKGSEATRTSATTAPSTAPATSSTTRGATSQPGASDKLLLYRLAAQGWEPQGPLPAEVATGDDAAGLSLGVAGGAPVVAWQAGPRAVRLYVRTGTGQWDAAPEVTLPEDVQALKVLGGTPAPALWVRGASGAGRLVLREPGGAPVVRELNVPNRADHAVAFAMGAIRVVSVEDGRIFERPLAPETGLPRGEVAVAPLPAPSLLPAVTFWVQATLYGALIFALAASLRRRREMQEIELDPAKLGLAPFSTRLLAGAIDAIPLIAASWFARARYEDHEAPGYLMSMAVGLGVYLLLTTLIEALAGRSLGKLLTGLHVVGLDGKPAGIGARLLRNLLRIIDLPIMPLALILFSPLRQRAGDLAAGTLVVRGKADERPRRAEGEDETSRAKKDADSR